MISQEIENYRIDNWIDSIQLPDERALRYYNNWRDVLIDFIISKKEDFFYDEITADIVRWQREYVLPQRWQIDWLGNKMWWLIKIKWLSIKYKETDANYTKLDNRVLENLDYDLNSYNNWNESFYVISDNSVFIYPLPTEDINEWLKIYWIFVPPQLEITDEETIFSQHKKVIMFYVWYKYFLSSKQIDIANTLKQYFDIEVNRITKSIAWRVQSPKLKTLPNLKNFY